MRRVANWFSACTLALALVAVGCAPQTSSSTDPAQVGAAEEPPAPYTPPSTTHPPALKNGQVNQTESQALTEYFKAHHLPLVGAQVLHAPDGQKQIILFGYVRTDYGKGDAESKARRYIKDPNVTVDNRIKIEPALANLNPSQSPDATAPTGPNPNDDDMAGLDQYQNQQYEDQMLQQQQMQAYQSNSSMGLPLGLLGLFGGMGGGGLSFGGGRFGGGFGGFGGPYGGYPPYGASPPPGYAYPPPGYYP